jgi:hypothetical protein
VRKTGLAAVQSIDPDPAPFTGRQHHEYDLTEALLLLSRADQRYFTREHVDLSLIAEGALKRSSPSQKNAASASRRPAR